LNNVNFTAIPLHIKGGVVLPLRVESAATTTALRKKDFEFVVAPGQDGTAEGQLYIDDGESIDPATKTEIKMMFENGILRVTGSFGFATGVNVARVRILNTNKAPNTVRVNSAKMDTSDVMYDAANKVLDVTVDLPFNMDLSVEFL